MVPHEQAPSHMHEPEGEAIDERATTKDSMVTIRLSGASFAGDRRPLGKAAQETVESEPMSRESGSKSSMASLGDQSEGEFDIDGIPQSSHAPGTPDSPIVYTDGPAMEINAYIKKNRSNSMISIVSEESARVDWEELEKTEKQEQRDEGSDASTAFLLARLEQENNALATNPKAGLARARARSGSRPPSIQQLKRLVNEPTRPSLRYSMLPVPPAMTELEFWAALVADYPQTAQRLPTLTSHKIRGGIPPPLRGVVWMSITGAREPSLEDEYDRLCGEHSPYEKLIGKDIGRSYPGVDMFRDPDGEGQKMLGKVLKAFSLWDQEIGYCQGLGFVVGPLLMHMGDKEAFCVLVRLMEHYDLRSCFLPDLSGLHLRVYQFQHLLSQHLPTLSAHLEGVKIEPLYLSQWFLSFFGVTCPLPMLLRIYDVILTEGASETLMRVALSLMRRNEKKILATTEFEEIMQLLLSRGLWDTYNLNADDLVNDFCGLTGLVTRESLESLETSFKEIRSDDATSPIATKPSIHSAASRFLGRFWVGTGGTGKPSLFSPSLTAPSRPVSQLRRTPSKQSMASTLSSIESAESGASTAPSDSTNSSTVMSPDWIPQKPASISSVSAPTRQTSGNKDKDLHSQIEDLLTALSDMQRDQTLLASELQKEREAREEDRAVVQQTVERIKKQNGLTAIFEGVAGDVLEEKNLSKETMESLVVLEEHFVVVSHKRSSIVQSKHQLREDVNRWKEQYNEEVAKSAALSRQLMEKERDNSSLREQLKDVRARVQDSHRDRQRLEKNIQDLKNRKSNIPDTAPDTPTSATSEYGTSSGGLREFKLGRPTQINTSQPSPVFSKRISSLSAQTVLSTEDHKPANEDALLLELVNAKTAEAVARQELEEVKGKLDSLRRLLGGKSVPPSSASQRQAPPSPGLPLPSPVKAAHDPPKPASPLPSGGFFSGWGKRAVSSSSVSGQ
ncbi:MAG: hypothetical protein MMC33_005029 [Icmadophila ericetorum]|nr:hypothetical protein [Icmadophila ericetorum]